MADNITITEGTAKAIAADDVGSVWYQRVKLDVGADGLTSAFTGTLTAKYHPSPAITAICYGTKVAGAASTWATISDLSGAGTSHVVSNVAVVVTAGTVDCYLGFGTTASDGGGSVLARGNFPAGGGITRSFIPSIKSGTNSEICANIGGAGTVQFSAVYWEE